MSHIRIDKQKALKKWAPVLENMGVAGEERLDWMSEYAEFHSINENAYVNATLAGMGSVQSPVPSIFPGFNQNTASPVSTSNYASNNGNFGSGDLGQNLLPVAMKIAAQTIGLDLVAVKPSPGPKLDLLYIDFQYDDVDLASGERPQVFKCNVGTTASGVLAGLTAGSTITQTQGGLVGGRVFLNIATSSTPTYTEPTGSKAGILEFLGFSRIDGLPMFKAYRQANTAGQFNTFGFDDA